MNDGGKRTNASVLENTNSAFKINGGSYTCTVPQSKNIVFFDACSQADRVQNTLTLNIENTADNFLKESELKKKIGKKFKTQLESLSKCHEALIGRVKYFDTLKDDKKIALGKALVGINGFYAVCNCKMNYLIIHSFYYFNIIYYIKLFYFN